MNILHCRHECLAYQDWEGDFVDRQQPVKESLELCIAPAESSHDHGQSYFWKACTGPAQHREPLRDSLDKFAGSTPAGLLLEKESELGFSLGAESVCLGEELSHNERKLHRGSPVTARKAVNDIVALCKACWPPCSLKNINFKDCVVSSTHVSACIDRRGRSRTAS